MTLVVPDVGEVVALQFMLNFVPAQNQTLRLFNNNYTPDENTTLGNLTEATETGYAAISLTGTNWTIGTLSGVTSAVYAQQTFTFTATANIYGYYITTNPGGQLMWVERFSGAPFALPGGGGTISITPRITAD